MSLVLANVSLDYPHAPKGGKCALDGVSLEVRPGRMLLVVGTTGSGKTTLLRVAAGLLAPSRGAAHLDGVPLNTRTARGEVGLVFQDAESQLFAESLAEDVAFGPRNLGVAPTEAHARALDALRSVGLDPDVFASRSPFTLSGGEARRAAIAGVLAMRPRYLLADEPTAGLDAKGRAAVRALILDQRLGAGVMVVSHDADQFLADADDVLVLREGRVAWAGSAREAIADPSVFHRGGVTPPDVIEVQHIARECGASSEAVTIDPVEAAERLTARWR